jgi:hypothetical protein
MSRPDAIAFAHDVLRAAGAEPVPAFDVDAVAREINLGVSQWYYADPGMSEYSFRDDAIAAISQRRSRPAVSRAPNRIAATR